MKLHINADGRDVGQQLLLAKMAHPDPTLLPLPASSRSHSTSSETEGEGDRGGDGIMNRLGKELAVVAEVLTNGTAQDPLLSSPSPNPPPSPPSGTYHQRCMIEWNLQVRNTLGLQKLSFLPKFQNLKRCPFLSCVGVANINNYTS